jgi:MFS family permease
MLTLRKTPARRREAHALLASALTNGPAELVDFVLPLWAGLALGASATEVGVLVALEMAVSVVVRPLAGVLADARERRHVAAAGAAAYGLACAAYALAGAGEPGIALAYGAAALGGAGGALLWVSLRALIGERLAEDSGAYARLMASRENGAWLAFVAGLSLLGLVDFTGVFLGCAAACLAASAVLLAAPRRAPGAPAAGRQGLGVVGRRLRPMLLAVALTMTAEAAVGMLLLLHLQRGFDLEVVEAAYVFLPGAIVMGLLPQRLHAVVVRFGRTRVLTLASVSSAAFALSLAWAPNPYAIAGLWILSGVAWAAVMPVQEAVVAEASGGQTGRGMGLYEASALVGGAIGALAAGVLYDASSWSVACVVASAVILAGAVITPRAVRRLGVANFPPPSPAEEPAGREPPPSPAPVEPVEPVEPTEPVPASPPGPPRPARRQVTVLVAHAATFTLAQAGLAAAGLSWLADLATGDTWQTLMRGEGDTGDLHWAAELCYDAGRVWVFVLLVAAAVQTVKAVAVKR